MRTKPCQRCLSQRLCWSDLREPCHYYDHRDEPPGYVSWADVPPGQRQGPSVKLPPGEEVVAMVACGEKVFVATKCSVYAVERGGEELVLTPLRFFP